MQGHQYIALRVLNVQDGNEEVRYEPGTKIPTRISDTWAAPAIRAMVNCGHIQFAKIEDVTTLPYLADQKKAKRAAGVAKVDAKPVPALAEKPKGSKRKAARRAEA